jgi:hypothetical protein
MDLKALTEENLAELEEKIQGDPGLRDTLQEDLVAGLESMGYYIPAEEWDALEPQVRRIVFDLKPLSEEEWRALEEKIQTDPELEEKLLEDLEAGLESLGYYMSDDLFTKVDRGINAGLRKGLKAIRQEVNELLMDEESRQKRTITVEVGEGGE